MYPPQAPAPIAPLGPNVTDMQVLNETPDAPKLVMDTDEAKWAKQIVEEYDKAEEFVRNPIVRQARKQMNYWNNLQYLAWDEVAHDWRTPEQIVDEDPQADIDPALYAKVVNIYKAHGEVLIGALSSGVPTVKFFPKDADDHEDITAAKARSKIAELIQKHNRARLLLMKSLFIMYNQGLVACYNENKSDTRFGVNQVPEYADVDMTSRQHLCPACGSEMGNEEFPADPENPMGPAGMPPQPCPDCGNMVEPIPEDQTQPTRQQIGTRPKPKSRECLEVFGPLNVKVPVWAKDQISCPYLILETEEHVAMMREIYNEIADKILPTSYPDVYDREMRVQSKYKNDFPREMCTVQRVWLRPWAYNIYGGTNFRKEEVQLLKKKYPDGLYIVIINHEIVAEMVPDKLDDHWTIVEHPMSESLYVESIGSVVVPMQDITNELVNLTLETVEFGIPEVFADGRVLDFDAYQRHEARPGQVSQATAPAGQSLGEGFFTVKAATLSKEVEPFSDRIQTTTQFLLGSYPSIFGGALEGGSGTAKEYEMSKASALQRLSTTWTILQIWWCQVIKKSTDSFVQNMKGDESYAVQKGGSFMNVWIRQSELSGEIGDTEPEISEQFPVSWSQKRDILLNLMQMKNADIDAVIRHPENAGLVAALIGVPELYIPGDDDRSKQLAEIAELIQGEPTETPAPMRMQMQPGQPPPQPQMTSSVPVDQLLDNHQAEEETCKAWLKSEVGMDTKKNNPAGWMNVHAHMQEHDKFVQQAAMAAQMAAAQGQGEPGKSNDQQMTSEMGV